VEWQADRADCVAMSVWYAGSGSAKTRQVSIASFDEIDMLPARAVVARSNPPAVRNMIVIT